MAADVVAAEMTVDYSVGGKVWQTRVGATGVMTMAAMERVAVAVA